ncbi:hypothetical protein BDW59DRAFT_62907 [Aspergillus cavernicola]|uniref:Secreted protein n=1 Tax=Aspergillus cavernicola TaxID=176166 RepID=A0ABR4IHF7_9EURO
MLMVGWWLVGWFGFEVIVWLRRTVDDEKRLRRPSLKGVFMSFPNVVPQASSVGWTMVSRSSSLFHPITMLSQSKPRHNTSRMIQSN